MIYEFVLTIIHSDCDSKLSYSYLGLLQSNGWNFAIQTFHRATQCCSYHLIICVQLQWAEPMNSNFCEKSEKLAKLINVAMVKTVTDHGSQIF